MAKRGSHRMKNEKKVAVNSKFQKNLKDVYAVLLIAVGLLLITFASIKGAGFIGVPVNKAMQLLFGFYGRYIFPVFLIFWSIHFLISKEEDSDTFGYGLLIGFVSLLTLFHLWLPLNQMIKISSLNSYGGIVGSLFAYAFKFLFGLAGGYIVSIFCLIIGLMLVTEIKISSIFHWIIGSLKNIKAYFEKEEPPIQKVNVRESKPVEIKDTKEEIAEPAVKIAHFIEDNNEEAEEVGSENKTIVLPQSDDGEYVLPPLSIYKVAGKSKGSSKKDIQENVDLLSKTLHNFDVEANVSRVVTGPTVTRYEIQLASGVKVNKILNLADDIALTFASPDVRIIAPIPGKSAIGIEVPNSHRDLVTIGEILRSNQAQMDNNPLLIGLGKDISGNPILADLGDMPHLLIAGATGSGKSVCLNAIISSILTRTRPDEVKLIMIDPKRVELTLFNGIAHLLTPVVTNSKQAAHALAWACQEMDTRYDILSEHGVKNIKTYNKKIVKEGGDKMPFIVLIIDELADLMMVAPREVEEAICRLAQLARAVGIHLIVATQRPSTDVITGLIKANIIQRIAFAVSSMTDSRVILDTGGAEKLVGKGDALFSTPASIKPQRIQAAFITEDEIEALTTHIRSQAQPDYVADITKPAQGSMGSQDFDDDLFDDAMEMVISTGKASVSYLQRRLRIGYGRAARLMDMMEDKGIVSPQDGSRPREVLVTPSEIEPENESIEMID